MTTDTDPNQHMLLRILETTAVQPHPRNVRAAVGDVTDLADSIVARGILHPLVVVPDGRDTDGDRFRIIAGHRRHAAAQLAGLQTVPCIVRTDLNDEADQLAQMLAENVERADLTVFEEAAAVQGLLDLGDTISGAAKRTGMSRKRVSDRVKIAKLPDDVKVKAAQHQLSMEDTLFVAKHSTHPQDAELLERHLGTSNWEWAKQRVTEIAAHRRRRDKMLAACTAAGVEFCGTHGEAYEWRDGHGLVAAHISREPWHGGESGIAELDPATQLIMWPGMNPESYLWTFTITTPAGASAGEPTAPVSPTGDLPAATDRDDDEPDAASLTVTSEQARPAQTDAEGSRVQRNADLQTAATVRRNYVRDMINRAYHLEDDQVLELLRLAVCHVLEEYVHVTGDMAETTGIPVPADAGHRDLEEAFAIAVAESDSLRWLVAVLVVVTVGDDAHYFLREGGSYLSVQPGHIRFFEILGHTWSDVERAVIDKSRADRDE